MFNGKLVLRTWIKRIMRDGFKLNQITFFITDYGKPTCHIDYNLDSKENFNKLSITYEESDEGITITVCFPYLLEAGMVDSYVDDFVESPEAEKLVEVCETFETVSNSDIFNVKSLRGHYKITCYCGEFNRSFIESICTRVTPKSTNYVPQYNEYEIRSYTKDDITILDVQYTSHDSILHTYLIQDNRVLETIHDVHGSYQTDTCAKTLELFLGSGLCEISKLDTALKAHNWYPIFMQRAGVKYMIIVDANSPAGTDFMIEVDPAKGDISATEITNGIIDVLTKNQPSGKASAASALLGN